MKGASSARESEPEVLGRASEVSPGGQGSCVLCVRGTKNGGQVPDAMRGSL